MEHGKSDFWVCGDGGDRSNSPHVRKSGSTGEWSGRAIVNPLHTHDIRGGECTNDPSVRPRLATVDAIGARDGPPPHECDGHQGGGAHESGRHALRPFEGAIGSGGQKKMQEEKIPSFHRGRRSGSMCVVD